MSSALVMCVVIKSFGDFDVVLRATGRRPLTDGLGLDKIGVEVNSSGHIVVDEYQNTSVPGITAIGDVVGKVELTPVSSLQLLAIAFLHRL